MIGNGEPMLTTTVRNNRGSVLMQVLAATAVLGISFYSLTNYVISQKRQVSTTVNAVNLRFALNSTMDYVIFGVRQKYCFTDDGLLMNAPTDQCTLTNTGSIERLIMSAQQQNFIQMMAFPSDGSKGVNFGTGVDYNNLALTEIHRYIKISNLVSAHPLFSVMQQLKNVKDEITHQVVKVGQVKVDILRDDSKYLPRAGREVYLRVNLSLLDTNGNVITLGSAPLTLSSAVAIYPREVGSFALLMANDLHLDLPYNAVPSTGDVIFHQFENRKVVQGPGLTFLSPVFVNRDIYLPQVPDDETITADNTKYSAVTFADRVVMGNGWIRSGDNYYAPRSAGASNDRYWSDAVNFGGFLKGVENDGGLDAGLLVFAKINTGAAPDTKLMSQCIALSQQQSSAATYYNSALGASLTSSKTLTSESKFVYGMYFNSYNSFNPQSSVAAGTTDASNWGSGKSSFDKNGSAGPVFDMTLAVGTRTISFKMQFGSDMTLTPQVGSDNYNNTLQGNVTTATNGMTLVNNTIIAGYQKIINADKDAIRSEEQKPDPPVSGPAPASVGGTTTSTSTDTTASTTTSTDTTATLTTSTSTTVTYDPTKYKNQSNIDEWKADIQTQNGNIDRINSGDYSQISTSQLSDVQTAQKAITDANTQLANYQAAVANPPVITISADKVKSNKANITFDATNVSSLIDENGNSAVVSLKIKAYDNTYSKGSPISGTENPKLTGYLNFDKSANKKTLLPPASLAATTSNSTLESVSDDSTDWDGLAQLCEQARNAAASASFGGASWDVDFSPSTRSSWNFAGDSDTVSGQDPAINKDLVFNSASSPAPNSGAPNWPNFRVSSIVKSCTIQSSATLVTGFYACDTMTIEARSTPLRIIGSFIVGKLVIDPTAYAAGITWSSIYYPQATQELRSIGILHPSYGSSCNITSTSSPIWHPIPSAQELANRMTCNAVSLRAKADPFQWTAVDPDCGLPSTGTASNTICKRRLLRFFVVEQSREEGVKL